MARWKRKPRSRNSLRDARRSRSQLDGGHRARKGERIVNESYDRVRRDGRTFLPRIGGRGGAAVTPSRGSVTGLGESGRQDRIGSIDQFLRPFGKGRGESSASRGL